jgi:DNA-3-methyladenine glycosylase I
VLNYELRVGFELITMSGPPRVWSLNTTEPNLEDEARPVLVPGGNKKPIGPLRKPTVKPTALKPAPAQPDKLLSNEGKKEPKSCMPPSKGFSKKVRLKGHELLLHPNLSLNASCSSDMSTESFSSWASTGRIGRQFGPTARLRVGLVKREKSVEKVENGVGCELIGERGVPLEKRRCTWITANSGLSLSLSLSLSRSLPFPPSIPPS